MGKNWMLVFKCFINMCYRRFGLFLLDNNILLRVLKRSEKCNGRREALNDIC